MERIRIVDVVEASGALAELYQRYRLGLPAEKRTFAASQPPLDLVQPPGLICVENGQPTAALLWQTIGEYPGFVLARFYAEHPQASQKAVQLLLEESLARTAAAPAYHFEFWTPPANKIHLALGKAGFQLRARELLAIRKPPTQPAAPEQIRFLSLMDSAALPVIKNALAHALHATYVDTVDGEFYEHFRTPAQCRAYLDRVLESSLCARKHCWLAWSTSDRRVAAMALCSHWPTGRVVYLEQLAVTPNYRSRGLGRVLLGRVCEALETGHARSIVLTVTTENQPARRLYYSLGASLLDTERAYVRRTDRADAGLSGGCFARK